MTMQDKLRGVAGNIEMLFPDDARVNRDVADELDAEAAAVTAARPGRTHRPGRRTENLAALLKSPKWGTQRALLMQMLYETNGHGLTHDEVEVQGPARGISTTAHRTRMGDLYKGEFVMLSERTRPSRTNTESEVWILTPKGLRYVEDQLERRRR